MKAVVCEGFGPPDVLNVKEVPAPVPAAGQVLVDTRACGVNFADTLIIAGKYQERPELPFVPGMEIAGVVARVADDVTTLAPGDRVLARPGIGGFAEQVAVPATDAMRIPNAMPFTEAAAFAVAYGTSHLALTRRAGLRAGEWLLVHGASGGVGLSAVEIGARSGATVIATASASAKLALAERYGARHLIDYSKGGFRDEVKKLTGGRGADVIFDPVGGKVFDESVRCVNWEGRILVVGFASGTIPSLPTNLALVKNFSVVGVFWGNYARRDPKTLNDSLATLLEWYAKGELRPLVSRTFPLERTADALNALVNRQSTGKVVVET